MTVSTALAELDEHLASRIDWTELADDVRAEIGRMTEMRKSLGGMESASAQLLHEQLANHIEALQHVVDTIVGRKLSE